MKNRRFLSFITALLLITCLTVTAFATEAKLDYVTDIAGLFSDAQRTALEQRAAALSE